VINVYSAADGERTQGGRTYSVDGIDTFPAHIPFSFHPVLVEIGEQSVDVIGSRRVPIPPPGVVL